MKYLMLLLIPVIAFSMGCGKPYIVGSPIEKAKVNQLVPGTTQEDKVVELFGQPFKKEAVGADQTKYVYTSFEERPRFWSKNVRIKHTLEVFTQGGMVHKYDLKKERIDWLASTE